MSFLVNALHVAALKWQARAYKEKIPKKRIMVSLLGLNVAILLPAVYGTRSGAIFIRSYERLTNCSSLWAKYLSRDARNTQKMRTQSKRSLATLRCPLWRKTTAGIKGRHDSVNIGTGLSRQASSIRKSTRHLLRMQSVMIHVVAWISLKE